MKSKNIINKVRKFVEEECKKPTSKYGFDPYIYHFVPVVKYAKQLANGNGADLEILEISAWLHDIGSIIYGRENHQVTGSQIAEKKLVELGYPQERIERVKHCILSHRGSQNVKRESLESQILADADGMSNFDRIEGLFKAAYTYENLSQKDARDSVRRKLEGQYKKLSEEAKRIIQDKYAAAMLLLK